MSKGQSNFFGWVREVVHRPATYQINGCSLCSAKVLKLKSIMDNCGTLSCFSDSGGSVDWVDRGCRQISRDDLQSADEVNTSSKTHQIKCKTERHHRIMGIREVRN